MLLAKKFGRLLNLISISQLLSTFLYRVFICPPELYLSAIVRHMDVCLF